MVAWYDYFFTKMPLWPTPLKREPDTGWNPKSLSGPLCSKGRNQREGWRVKINSSDLHPSRVRLECPDCNCGQNFCSKPGVNRIYRLRCSKCISKIMEFRQQLLSVVPVVLGSVAHKKLEQQRGEVSLF